MRDYLRTFSLCVEFGKTTDLQSRSRESGFKPPMSEAHLTIYRAVKLPEQSNKVGVSPRLSERQTIISNASLSSLCYLAITATARLKIRGEREKQWCAWRGNSEPSSTRSRSRELVLGTLRLTSHSN